MKEGVVIYLRWNMRYALGRVRNVLDRGKNKGVIIYQPIFTKILMTLGKLKFTGGTSGHKTALFNLKLDRSLLFREVFLLKNTFIQRSI